MSGIIAATNEDLEEAVRKRTFRQDLYYRLNVVSLVMPPLPDRLEDIPLLADHFVQLYSRKNKRPVIGVSNEAASLLTCYNWPGNVRELENAMEYAIVFGTTAEILPKISPILCSNLASPEGASPLVIMTLFVKRSGISSSPPCEVPRVITVRPQSFSAST